MFAAVAWALGAARHRPAADRRRASPRSSSGSSSSRPSNVALPGGMLLECVDGLVLMDALGELLDGFADRADPAEPAVRADRRHCSGTAVGVLPGIGPAMTVALLLPVTFTSSSRPARSSCSPGSTTAACTAARRRRSCSTPPASPLDHDRARGQPDGPGRPRRGRRWPPPPSAPSSPAPSPPCCWRCVAPAIVDLRRRSSARPTTSRSASSPSSPSPPCSARSPLRGLASPRPRPGHRPGRHRRADRAGAFTLGVPQLLDGIDVVVVAVGLFAVGEALYVAVPAAPRPGRGHRRSAALGMTRQDWRRSWKPWLRGTALGFPLGALPGRRRRDPDLPVVRDRAEAHASTRRSSARAPSRASPGRRRPTTPRPPACWCRCSRSACPTSATAAIMLAAFQQYGIQPGPLLFTTESAPGLGADRVAVHRQRHAAGAQPAAGRRLGEAAADPAALPLRRDPAVRLARLLRGERRPARPGAPAGPRAARLRDAALRLAGGARGDRADPRPDRRDQPAPRAGDQRGRPRRCWSTPG